MKTTIAIVILTLWSALNTVLTFAVADIASDNKKEVGEDTAKIVKAGLEGYHEALWPALRREFIQK